MTTRTRQPSKRLGHDDQSGFEFSKELLGEDYTAAINFDRLQKHPESGEVGSSSRRRSTEPTLSAFSGVTRSRYPASGQSHFPDSSPADARPENAKSVVVKTTVRIQYGSKRFISPPFPVSEQDRGGISARQVWSMCRRRP